MVNTYLRVFATAGLIIGAVIVLSFFSVKIQGHKEEGSEHVAIVVNDTMTVAEFGKVNNIPNPLLKEMFVLSNKSDLQKVISQTGLTVQQVREHFNKQLTLKAEYESRNWIKIPLKFGLTLALLIIVFFFTAKRQDQTGNAADNIRDFVSGVWCNFGI